MHFEMLKLFGYVYGKKWIKYYVPWFVRKHSYQGKYSLPLNINRLGKILINVCKWIQKWFICVGIQYTIHQ